MWSRPCWDNLFFIWETCHDTSLLAYGRPHGVAHTARLRRYPCGIRGVFYLYVRMMPLSLIIVVVVVIVIVVIDR